LTSARFSKDLFVDTAKGGWLTWFWVKRGWVRDVSNLAYAKRKCVSDFFREWGCVRFGRVYWFVDDVGWVSGIVGRPDANTNALLVSGGDFKFGVSYESVEGVVPPNEEPRIIDEFKGEVSLGCGVDAIRSFL
jgi:hypothetical protein